MNIFVSYIKDSRNKDNIEYYRICSLIAPHEIKSVWELSEFSLIRNTHPADGVGSMPYNVVRNLVTTRPMSFSTLQEFESVFNIKVKENVVFNNNNRIEEIVESFLVDIINKL